MARVIVRFAGTVDPLVRRKAISEGQRLSAGAGKQLVFMGYIITIKGGKKSTVATAVELGVHAIGLWGVALVSEQYGTYTESWRLPLLQRLKSGGGRIPVSVPPAQIGIGKTGLPVWERKVNLANYRHYVKSSQRNGGFQATQITFPVYLSGKAELNALGVSHATSEGLAAAGQSQDPRVSAWLSRSSFISTALRVVCRSTRGDHAIEVTDDWVSAELGAELVFTGGARREDTLDNVTAGKAWYYVGPTSFPRLTPDPDDGGSFSNLTKFAVTRESPLAYRQSCNPGVAVAGDATLLAATALAMDDAMYQLEGEWSPGGDFRAGYVSTRSLTWAFQEIGAALIAQAGEPNLVLMWYDTQPVTLYEQENYANFLSDSADVRYVRRISASRDLGSLPGNRPVVGAPAPAWKSASRIKISDLPDWFQPGTVAGRSSALRTALAPWGYAVDGYIPLITSDHVQPSMFGAVYTTEIDGVAEFVFGVKSLDNSLVPITSARRSIDDEPSTPSEAAIAVAKTGLVFVSANVSEPGGVVIETEFHDVIGPADCDQYAAGMSADYAVLPQVRFGCNLGGKRAYAVRAVRYERSPFLASALTAVGIGIPLPYTEGYLGRENTGVGGPAFYTDREFGPYPDRDQYEELWFVIDRVKYVVNTTALNGTIEPVTESKFGNTLLPIFQYDSPEGPRSNARRQLLGMFSDADEDEYKLLDFYADEFAPAGMEMNTFAQVSDTDIMFVLHRSGPINPFDNYAVVCRFSSLTGMAEVVSVVVIRRPAYMAITCYQHEIKQGEGIVQPACLILRAGRSDGVGEVFTSIDAGETWELLYDSESTKTLNFNGVAIRENGTPSLGLHILGRIGETGGDPRFSIRSPSAAGAE